MGQLIITVGREYGSGGHDIALELSKRFGINFYDKNILANVAEEKNVDERRLQKYDEVPRKTLMSRTVKGFSNSPQDNVAQIQFDYIRRKAESGESFVVVGRCSEYVLREHDNAIKVFIHANTEDRVVRAMKVNNCSEKEAEIILKKKDKDRKRYFEHYTGKKWGSFKLHDISVNSATLGFVKTVDALERYIRNFIDEGEHHMHSTLSPEDNTED